MNETIEMQLDGQSLADDVYADCDLMGIDEILEEHDEDETLMAFKESSFEETVVRYRIACVNAEQAWGVIEKDIASYPLCQNAKVRLLAKDGSVLKEFTLPMHGS